MPAHVFDGTLNTFSVGGASQLEYLQNAQFTFNSDTENGASVLYGGANTQETKFSGRFDISLFSDVSTGIRVSHLDLSAIGLNAVDMLALGNNSLRWAVRMNHAMKGSNGARQQFPQVTGREFSCELNMDFDAGTAPANLVKLFSSTYADRDMTMTFTLNGVAIAMPMRLVGAGIPLEQAGKQTYTLQLADRSGVYGSTITPGGTASLLEKAINSYRTVVAYSYQGASAKSIAISGSMVWDSYELNIEDGKLVPSKMSFLAQTITGLSVT